MLFILFKCVLSDKSNDCDEITIYSEFLEGVANHSFNIFYLVSSRSGRASHFFPRKITHIKGNKATISSMEKYGRLKKCPDRPDVLEYWRESVISHINEPRRTSKTGNVYYVPDYVYNIWLSFFPRP